MISIRRATPSDYPQLVAVWRRSVEATHDFLSAQDITAIELDVAQYLPSMSDLRVAHDGERVTGFVAIEDGTVEMLFVDASLQGQGIGSALLEAVTAGLERVRVDVNEQNPAGHAFYKAQGFDVEGRSELDGEGRAFPILHLIRRRSDSAQNS